jgi:hypothetical protein
LKRQAILVGFKTLLFWRAQSAHLLDADINFPKSAFLVVWKSYLLSMQFEVLCISIDCEPRIAELHPWTVILLYPPILPNFWLPSVFKTIGFTSDDLLMLK